MGSSFQALIWASMLIICGTGASAKEVNGSRTYTYGIDLCDSPIPDPCSPGGKWDPLVKKCRGVRSDSCYQCYSGEFCKDVVTLKDCLLKSSFGDPVVLAEYWTSGLSHIPCLLTPANYRPAYQFEAIPSMENAIKQLHKTVGNAETEGYTIVYGVGSTHVLFITIAVLSQNILDKCVKAKRTDCPFAVDVFVQSPYYFGYVSIVNMIKTAKWNPQANTTSEFTIEIVTHPNNPTGELRKPLVQDGSHVIYDMVYYWPMYTNASVKMSEDIMIFSSSKECGLGGTRFGWGLFKDASLASKTPAVVESTIMSVPEDSILRAYNSISQIINETPSSVTGMLPYHQFGREKIFSAFSRLSDAMKDCKGMDIQLMNDIAHSPGAYAWLKCASGVQCADELKKLASIEGSPGMTYGAINEYMRLSMFMPSVEMDIMIKKFTSLCQQ